MTKGRSGRSAITAAALGGFLAGAITMAVVLLGFSSLLRPPVLNSAHQGAPSSSAAATPKVVESAPRPLARPSVSADPLILPTAATPPTISAGPVSELRDRKLEVPVRGVDRSDLRYSFDEARRSTQNHEAIDILAPRNTPVLAVEDGTIVKLFDSKQGGTTLYQFDPTTRYAYYYAHLERYADGIKEGNHLQRGQVLGYVGTSGNAPKDTPHLHFAIYLLTDKKEWWQGTPIDPYDVLK